MSENKEIQVVQDSTPSAMISQAIASGADLSQVRELLALKKEFEADEARKAYARALVDTQSKIPVIPKTRKNTQTNSKYADLSDIVKVITPVYTKGGFSMTFYEGKAEKEDDVRICADVMHLEGHKETYHYDAPMDGKGIKGTVNMTQTHAKATTIQYGKRYLMCMVWNIPTGDDNDGNTTPVDYINEKQQSEMLDILDNLPESDKKKQKFLEFMKVESVDKVISTDYQKAMACLKTAK